MDIFNFCGKISLGKETEKFKPIERKDFTSGWTNTTVKFNCISNTNRVLCLVQGGRWTNDKKNTVKTFGKSTTDENGKVIKGDTIEIPWSKRFDEDQIEKVAGFRKYIVDTGDYKMRYKLQDAIKAFEDGTITDETMEEIGIDNIEDAKDTLEKAKAKRKEFIAEWDFAEYVAKLASSNKYKDSLFNISGNYEVQYNSEKDVFYTTYHVNRITLAADGAEPTTEMKVDFFYGEDVWDDSALEETGKVNLTGWVSYRDGSLKKNGFKPMIIAAREEEKKLNALKRKFEVDGDEIKQIGLTVNVIEGAERVELTVDMLSEEDRDDLDCGLVEWDDLKKAYGSSIIGDKMSEIRFVSLTAKKNVPQDTVYHVEDMNPAKAEDVVADIFADDENDEDDL